MKNLYLFTLLFACSEICHSQITPSIKSVTDESGASLFSVGSVKWLLPFNENPGDLATAYENDESLINALKGAALKPGFGQNSGSSVFVEIASYTPDNNILRFGLGINVSQSDLEDSTKTSEEIAFNKLTNGGGNIVLNLSRPLIFFKSGKTGFGILNFEVSPFADISVVNEDIYNPGWGVLTSVNFDYRIVNAGAGNLFRLGVMARSQFNLVNAKYRQKNDIDRSFDNLSISSVGGYLGFAMINMQFGYSVYNKTTDFFDDRKYMIRFEIIPVKF